MSEPDAEMRAVNPLEIFPGEQVWKTKRTAENIKNLDSEKSDDSSLKDNEIVFTDEEDIKLFL